MAPPAAHPLPLGSSSAQRQAAVCWPSTLEEFSEPPAAAGSGGSRSSRKLGGPARQRSFYVAPSLDDEDDEEAMLMEGASALRERQRSASCSDLGRLAAGTLAAGAGAAGPSSGAEPDAGCSGSPQRPQQQPDAADGDPALAATNTAAAADPTALAAAAQGPEARQRLLSSCTIDDLPIEVKPGLYIGSMLAERNRRRLRGTKITDILQVAEGLYPNHPLHFNYMNLQVQDCPVEDLVVHFPKCFEFIDAAIARQGNVLVHCAGGVSRSATVVLGYLMSRHNMSLDQSLAHLRTVRPWVNPNAGFEAQLREYERLGRDLQRWRAWRHLCPKELMQAAPVVVLNGMPLSGDAGASGGPHQQCMISIAPPAERQRGGGGGGDLSAFSRLNINSQGGPSDAASR